jgi:hypothetical protein
VHSARQMHRELLVQRIKGLAILTTSEIDQRALSTCSSALVLVVRSRRDEPACAFDIVKRPGSSRWHFVRMVHFSNRGRFLPAPGSDRPCPDSDFPHRLPGAVAIAGLECYGVWQRTTVTDPSRRPLSRAPGDCGSKNHSDRVRFPNWDSVVRRASSSLLRRGGHPVLSQI